MANIITIFRIICSIVLLFFPAFSPFFYVLYLIAGFTDMVDGTIARLTNTVSDLGAKLDTIADFIFVTVCIIKLLPKMYVKEWIYIWIAIIIFIKTINVIFGFIYRKKFVVEHTIMNKITGILLFIFPLTLTFIEIRISSIGLCAIATFSAIQEGHYIRIGREVV